MTCVGTEVLSSTVSLGHWRFTR